MIANAVSPMRVVLYEGEGSRPLDEGQRYESLSAGARLISVNPLRETLEDVFLRRVAAMGEGARGTP